MMPNNNLSEDQTFQAFISQLMAEKGLSNISAEEKAQVEQELKQQIDHLMEETIIDSLTDEQMVQLDQMLDADASDQEIEKFFEANGVDYVTPVQQRLEAFRQNYLKDSTMTNTTNNSSADQTPAGQPTQGTTSAEPGQSDVEGVAVPDNMTNMTKEEQ